MNFHKSNPVPTTSSNKTLKIRLQGDIMSCKRNSTPEGPVPLHLPPHKKTTIFIEINNPTPVDSVVAEEHTVTNTKRNLGRTSSTRRRLTIGERGNNSRGGPYDSQYQPTPESIDWRDTVKNFKSELKTDIMKEIQNSVSAQIKELASTPTTQVTNSIKEWLSLQPATIPEQNIKLEVEADPEPITQKSQPTNEEITDINFEVEPRKWNEHLNNKNTNGTSVLTPTRLSRLQAKTRN